MILFFLSASLLVILCLSWIMLGLFRSSRNSTDQQAVNIRLARERRSTLDAALADGSIDQETYDYEREQLEYDLAADLRLESEATPSRDGHLPAAIITAVFVPVLAGALYLLLGDPAAIDPARQALLATGQQAGAGARGDNGVAQDAMGNGDPSSGMAMNDLLPQLEARLQENPDDVAGWRLLGRSYLSVSEFAKARTALERAVALDDSDPATLAQLAEAIAMIQEGDLAGKPFEYLQKANELDPDNEHALWLLSIAQQQKGEHEAALQGFDRLAAITAGNPDALATINQMRGRSQEALGLPISPIGPPMAGPMQGPADMTGEAAEQPAGPPVDADAAPASIEVSVTLGDTAASSAQPTDSVFIFARAASGPPMPLAVSRVTVADLPITVTLDDSMAMVPNMKLSSFPEVTIGARVSPSGNPIAQSGDWSVEQSNILTSDTGSVSLTIDSQLP